jgi:hypothetical protein
MLKVVENFGEAADTGEAGVAGRRPGGEKAAFEYEDALAGGMFFEADRCGKTYYAAPEEDAVVLEKALFFPVAEHGANVIKNTGIIFGVARV